MTPETTETNKKKRVQFAKEVGDWDANCRGLEERIEGLEEKVKVQHDRTLSSNRFRI